MTRFRLHGWSPVYIPPGVRFDRVRFHPNLDPAQRTCMPVTRGAPPRSNGPLAQSPASISCNKIQPEPQSIARVPSAPTNLLSTPSPPCARGSDLRPWRLTRDAANHQLGRLRRKFNGCFLSCAAIASVPEAAGGGEATWGGRPRYLHLCSERLGQRRIPG